MRPAGFNRGALVFGAACVLALMTLMAAPIITKKPLLVVVLPVACAVMVVMVLNFRWMLLMMLMTRCLLDPILNMTRVGGGTGLGGLLNLFVIALVFLTAARFPEKVKRCRPLIPWFIFIGLAGVTVLFSPIPKQSIRLCLTLVTYACMLVAPFLVCEDEKDRTFWMRVLLLSSLLPVGIACLAIFIKHPMLHAYDRLSGTFTHANILAFYVLLMLGVSFGVLKSGSLKLGSGQRFFLRLHMVFMLLVLVVTETRSAWAACAAFMLIYGIFWERKYLVLFVVGILLLAATPPVRTRLADLMEGTGKRRTEQLNSMAWRMRLWESSVPSILRKPVLGHGVGTFQHYSRYFFDLEKKRGAPAHNVYVEVMFETGLLGLLSYLSIFGSILVSLFRSMKKATAPASREAVIAFLCLLAYLLVSYSDNILYYLAFNWYLWFFMGLVLVGFLPKPADPDPPAEETP